MVTNDRGPVNISLLGGATVVVFVALLVYQHFALLSLGSLCRTWLLLPLLLG